MCVPTEAGKRSMGSHGTEFQGGGILPHTCDDNQIWFSI